MADFLRIDQTAAGNIARRGSRTVVASLTAKVAEHAMVHAPGSMKHHIRSFMGPGGVGFVVCDHPAAIFVLKGTKPHMIYPRNKSVLRFESHGGLIYAKKVSHPGTKPNNFLLKGLRSL